MRPIASHQLWMTPKKYEKQEEKKSQTNSKQQKQEKGKRGLSVLKTDLLNSYLILLSFRQSLWQ